MQRISFSFLLILLVNPGAEMEFTPPTIGLENVWVPVLDDPAKNVRVRQITQRQKSLRYVLIH